MTGLGNRESHEHIRGRGFEALDTKSTWSSFDDIAWDDFGDDDHSVPEPNDRTPASWLRRRREAKNWREVKEEEEEAQPSSKMDAAAAAAETVAAMDVDSWDNLNVGELGAVPDNLAGIGTDLKQESGVPLLGGYNDEDASIVTSSGHFSFSGVPDEEEMTLFGGESGGGGKGSGLLGYAWESLEDMDTLFQNEEAPFGQDAADALLQWPQASSSSPDSSSPAAIAKASPELRAMKGKSHDRDMKMEFIPCESLDRAAEASPSSAEQAAAMDLPAADSTHSGADKAEAMDSMSPMGKQQASDADKAHPGKRQASSKKRNDERSKKLLCPKRPGIGYPRQQPLPHYSSSQPLQLKPSVASTLQVYPQVIAGHAAAHHLGPVHHSPYLVQPGGRSQAVMVCYDQADAHPQQRFGQETRQLLSPPPPPASGTNMTPQEKIEKLRWKQKMHRLASEQHQQMANQCGLSINSHQALQSQRGQDGSAAAVKMEDGDGASSAVLNELLGIMTKLDVGTRICIRDALYRLARSAITRHTADGPSSSEGSNNSDNTLSRAIRYPLLETETNPIDRTIANLLFHKRSSESSHASTPNNSSNSAGSVVNIPGLGENRAPWSYQQRQQQQQDQQRRDDVPSETRGGGTGNCSESAGEASDGKSGGRHRRRETSSSSEFLSNKGSRGMGMTSSSSGDSSVREAGKTKGMQ